jgi:hypothetical protein
MRTSLIIFGYLKWHYSKAIYSLTEIWGNFLYFIFEFFSISLLFKNFFDPWKRMSDQYPKNFDLKKYFYAFVTNIIVRIVGIIMRTVLIIIGLSCYILTAIFYPIVIIVWLVLPFILLAMFGLGLSLIIK